LKTVPQGRALSWLSVFALAALAVAAATDSVATATSTAQPSSSSGTSAQTSLAGFAGYDEIVPVLTEIATSFRVPSVLSAPPKRSFATASTWIGAQNTAGSFVQVGVTEFVSWGPTGPSPDVQFNAFWSSTSLDFHPDSFEKVSAGDEITVKMSLEASGWVLSFFDHSSGYSHTIDSHYGAGQSFSAAEWIQEDPISSANLLQNLPYPSLSDVRFSGLEIDRTSPELGPDNGRAMDVPGGPWLVPTIFASDGFGVIPATGYEKQYLADVAGYNLALLEFGIGVFAGKPGIDNSKVRNATVTLIHALGQFEHDLATQVWPNRDDTDVQALLIQSDNMSRDLGTLEQHPTADIETTIYSDEALAEEAAERLRMDLGLPPPA
jgi:Peptidase A4 family